MRAQSPKTKEDFENYYDLRWRILRKSWNQPRESEKDDLESKSIHIMFKKDGVILGVGRAHFNSKDESQIRYMAIEKKHRRKGIGTIILKELEKIIKKKGGKIIVLNSRESAVNFYKKYGYSVIKRSHNLFGSIPHYKMKKKLLS
ncbi:GNAT family N-acetyltransferase [Candidatus Woesearchaeota archaeon]|nr:GNAT family N-acetyltransferase [Candidatus Woesearchaeota archaeon]